MISSHARGRISLREGYHIEIKKVSKIENKIGLMDKILKEAKSMQR